MKPKTKPASLAALLLVCLAAPLFAADYRDEALADAIMRGDRARVRSLLNSGANVNARLQEGYTPIMLAASFGGMEIVKILLDAGADVNAQAESGNTALIFAAMVGNTETANSLRRAGAK